MLADGVADGIQFVARGGKVPERPLAAGAADYSESDSLSQSSRRDEI